MQVCGARIGRRPRPSRARIFTYIPKTGYVGVGEVTSEAQPADEAILTVYGNELPSRNLELSRPYRHEIHDEKDGEDYRGWVLPVRWITTTFTLADLPYIIPATAGFST